MNIRKSFFRGSLASTLLVLILLPSISTAASITVTNVWINEIHYDNDGADEDEGVEIAAPAGTDLSKYKLYFYNGSDSKIYDTKPLEGITPDEKNSYGTKWFPIESIQNGAPDAIALVMEHEDQIHIIQFISYEGVITAVDGPASGLTSTDIGVMEKKTQSPGFSLQLIGIGYIYANFTWKIEQASPGVMNAGQKVNRPRGTAIVIR